MGLDIKRIAARARMAAPGPWKHVAINPVPGTESHYANSKDYHVVSRDGERVIGVEWIDGPWLGLTEENSQMICHAREDILALCDYINQLEEQVDPTYDPDDHKWKPF